jgi:outer membrane protein OmpA-like peptidoglycan-associated protein
MLAVGALALQACATKGYVRKQVAASAATTQIEVAAARDSAIRSATATSEAANASLEQRVNTRIDEQIAALRNDLTALRQEFNTKITMMEDSLKLIMPVNFAFNDATVRESDKPAVAAFASLVKKHYPSSRITIEGFADPAGSSSYNARLSRERAEAVRSALIEMGVDGSHLSTIGYGETRLVNARAQKDDAGAEQNRRVVFAIETVGAPVTMAMLVGR